MGAKSKASMAKYSNRHSKYDCMKLAGWKLLVSADSCQEAITQFLGLPAVRVATAASLLAKHFSLTAVRATLLRDLSFGIATASHVLAVRAADGCRVVPPQDRVLDSPWCLLGLRRSGWLAFMAGSSVVAWSITTLAEVWRRALGSIVRDLRCDSHSETVFAGTAAGELHALSGSTGESLWRAQVGYPIESVRCSASSIVLCFGGTSGAAFCATSGTMLFCTEGLWGHRCPHAVVTSADACFAGCKTDSLSLEPNYDHVVATCTSSGHEIWRKRAPADAAEVKLLGDDTLLIGTASFRAGKAAGALIAWDAATGEHLFRTDLCARILDLQAAGDAICMVTEVAGSSSVGSSPGNCVVVHACDLRSAAPRSWQLAATDAGGQVTCMRFCADLLVSWGTSRGAIALWDARCEATIWRVDLHEQVVAMTEFMSREANGSEI